MSLVYDTGMLRTIICLSCFMLIGLSVWAAQEKQPSSPSFDYETTRAHEIKPHRRTIRVDGISPGFNQLRLTLTISPTGDVVDADASGDQNILKFWPQLQGEVREWKFTPFEKNGESLTAEVEEYIDLVPPERLPKKHVQPPVIRRNSKIEITLRRSGCFGSCPSYEVAMGTEGIVFEGGGYVVARGKHIANIETGDVRKLAKKFVAADFYSMDANYSASVTDSPGYSLSIAVDGNTKTVEDYVGAWVGMPAIVTDLEDEVDEVARTNRWIRGGDGLVQALQAEKFNFHTFEGQLILKEASTRGRSETVQGLLDAGVPLEPLPAPKPKDSYTYVPLEPEGWLNAASGDPKTLQVLIQAEASKKDQKDKDLALAGAARAGNLEGAKALISYGANPNANLSKLTVTESGAGVTSWGPGAGSVLLYAAESGNPDMVREILRYHPKLEMRGEKGKTAIFAAGEYRPSDKDGARVECVRLLVRAGADVNARDEDGNTPLHETFLTDVEEELLRLGADVNARNNDGETPIFTTVDDDAIPLFIRHGADLSIRNNQGETVLEAAKDKGPQRQETLRKVIQEMAEH